MKIKKFIKSTARFCMAAVICSAALTGCGMTNDEVIKEVDKCKKANMEPRVVMNLLSCQIVNILCVPKQ